jgi:hypothetical protein
VVHEDWRGGRRERSLIGSLRWRLWFLITALEIRQQELAARAQRRAFALSASIEDVLVAAADRASDRLKRERPEFSAATLNNLAYFIPSLWRWPHCSPR